MIEEITSAANFLCHLMYLSEKITQSELKLVHDTLLQELKRRFKQSWNIIQPPKGSAYRCIRINGTKPPLFNSIEYRIGIDSERLIEALPHHLTLYIDPGEVSYRLGQTGMINVLYETNASNGPWIPGSTLCDDIISRHSIEHLLNPNTSDVCRELNRIMNL